jgi:hypothetical protein
MAARKEEMDFIKGMVVYEVVGESECWEVT